MKRFFLKSGFWLLLLSFLTRQAIAQNKTVVFQSDFGLKDGAVSAMKGVAHTVSSELKLYDLTHDIPAYNIWEAAYRLEQTVRYWPAGTVFVSVVDPGVGTQRRSVVLKTQSGHFIVTPDNGTLTLVAASLGIAAVREINEAVNRRTDSEQSYTFHGRDVYAYTGARLAAGYISFEEVGPLLAPEVVIIVHQAATLEGQRLKGTIPILDIQYGNVWTNIDAELLKQLHLSFGQRLKVMVYEGKTLRYSGTIPYGETFGSVPKGKPLVYLNSLLRVSLALNQASFAKTYGIKSGPAWQVTLEPEP